MLTNNFLRGESSSAKGYAWTCRQDYSLLPRAGRDSHKYLQTERKTVKTIRQPLAPPSPSTRVLHTARYIALLCPRLVLLSWYLLSWYPQGQPRDSSTHCPHATWPYIKFRAEACSQMSSLVHIHLPHRGTVLWGESFLAAV